MLAVKHDLNSRKIENSAERRGKSCQSKKGKLFNIGRERPIFYSFGKDAKIYGCGRDRLKDIRQQLFLTPLLKINSCGSAKLRCGVPWVFSEWSRSNSESIYHWQNVQNFGRIFEQNASINFEPIFKKSVNFGRIFEKSVNFEHFVNGKWSHYKLSY